MDSREGLVFHKNEICIQCGRQGVATGWNATLDVNDCGRYLCKNAMLCREYREKAKEKVADNMSVGSGTAAWCDYADHPFKAGRVGTFTMAMQGEGNQEVRNGAVVAQQTLLFCPECAAELGLNPHYEAPDDTPMQRRAILAPLVDKARKDK